MKRTRNTWAVVLALAGVLSLTGCGLQGTVDDLIQQGEDFVRQLAQEAEGAANEVVNRIAQQRGGQPAPPPEDVDQVDIAEGAPPPVGDQGGVDAPADVEPIVDGEWITDVNGELDDFEQDDLENGVMVLIYNSTGLDMWVSYAYRPIGGDEAVYQQAPIAADSYALVYYECFEMVVLLADLRWDPVQQEWLQTDYYPQDADGPEDFPYLAWLGADFECGYLVGIEIMPDGQVDAIFEDLYDSYDDDTDYGDPYDDEYDYYEDQQGQGGYYYYYEYGYADGGA